MNCARPGAGRRGRLPEGGPAHLRGPVAVPGLAGLIASRDDRSFLIALNNSYKPFGVRWCAGQNAEQRCSNLLLHCYSCPGVSDTL